MPVKTRLPLQVQQLGQCEDHSVAYMFTSTYMLSTHDIVIM